MQPRRPVFLLGMMGSGKTTVGRVLAQRWHASFIDLDVRVERLFGASIPALFELGEDYFRACERAALTSLVREPGFSGAAAVVATGGGIVCDPDNLDVIAAAGRSVYLEVGAQELVARLSTPEQQAARPLLAREHAGLAARVTALLRAREQGYRRAGVTVDAEAPPEEVADRVARALASAEGPTSVAPDQPT